MFEHHRQPLLSRNKYFLRQAKYALIAAAIVLGSLAIGMAGYHFLEGLSWVDALVNSAMILGGMGPVNVLQTDAGKIFASFYALYSGIIFLVAAGILFAPVYHRFLHRFHLNLPEEPTQKKKEQILYAHRTVRRKNFGPSSV